MCKPCCAGCPHSGVSDLTPIQSFTFVYDPREDRVRLICNMDKDAPRRDYWLTRRLTLELFAGCEKLLLDSSRLASRAGAARREVLRMEHETALQATDTQVSPSGTASANPSRASMPQAHLVTRIDITPQKGKYEITLFEDDQASAFARLSRQELHRVLRLLYRSSADKGWAIQSPLLTDVRWAGSAPLALQ